MIFRSKSGNRTRVPSLPWMCSTAELSRSEVESLPLGASVVLPASVLPYFLPRNLFVGILITSSPVGVEVQSFVPVEGIPFI